MMRRGFTVVELVITIAIMGILLTLAVVNLNSTQVNARNTERKTDAENIARHLENYYTSVNPKIPGSGQGYPYASLFGTTAASLNAFLPDLDVKNMYAPDTSETGPVSIVPATNASRLGAGLSPSPSPAAAYIYQPLTVDNTLCNTAADGECRKFYLYYYQEDGSPSGIVSNHQ